MSLAKLILINATLTVALLLAIEGCVRVTHPEIRPMVNDRSLIVDSVYARSAGLRPEAHGLSMGTPVSVSPDRFWVYSHQVPQSSSGWLLLGDSVTMGIGVDPDSTFAGRLSAVVSDSLRVLNPAVIGYDSFDYLNVLSALLDRQDLRIERATLFWCLNDVYANLPVKTAPHGLRKVVPFLRNFIYRHVRTYQWLKAAFFDRPRAYYLHDKQFYTESGDYLRKAIDDLAQIKAVTESSGILFQVVLLPYEYQLRTNDFLPQQVMKENLSAAQISVVDLAGPLAELPNPGQLFLYGDGMHFSEFGHRHVFQYLQRTGVFPDL
jgi:hypothetical protein